MARMSLVDRMALAEVTAALDEAIAEWHASAADERASPVVALSWAEQEAASNAQRRYWQAVWGLRAARRAFVEKYQEVRGVPRTTAMQRSWKHLQAAGIIWPEHLWGKGPREMRASHRG